ncbi:MAG TPA: hypothetical protein VHB98_24915, partial [Chloroflexota bacterium]|nr:hypothetical protein [Chloroflexota bacterium]
MDQNVKRLRARAEEQQQASIREVVPLESLVCRPGRTQPGAGDQRDDAGWHEAGAGTRWGGAEPWATFKATFRVPEGWADALVRLA